MGLHHRGGPGDNWHLQPDPQLPDVFWASSFGSGVWKSVDGGRSWVPKSKGLANLMIDVLHIDGSNPADPYLYAFQSPLHGAGNGWVHRSRDWGESWEPVGVCQHRFAPRTYFHNAATGPGGAGPRTLWVTQSSDQDNCGLVFRSLDQGQTWCSIANSCSTDLLPLNTCPLGPGEIPGATNDGGNVVAIHESTPPELYFMHAKYFVNDPCRNLFRTPLATPSSDPQWQLFDRWTGPTLQNQKCRGRELDRMRTGDLTYDPESTQYRFAEHKEFLACIPCSGASGCERSNPNNVGCFPDARCTGACPPLTPCGCYSGGAVQQLKGLSLAVSDVTPLPASDREWRGLIELMSCFGLPENLVTPEVGPIRLSKDGGVKEIFARFAGNQSQHVLYCDATAGTAGCTQASNWQCIWNDSTTDRGCNTPGGIFCPGKQPAFAPGLVSGFEKMAVSTKLVNNHHELLLLGRRRYARDEILRIYHDGTEWQQESPRDPVSCNTSGPGLLTPLQVVEFPTSGTPPGRMLMTSPRQLFKKDPGSPWSVLTHSFNQMGPFLALAPSDPQVAYALAAEGIYRTADQGNTWVQVETSSRKHGECEFPCFYLNACDGCPVDCRNKCAPDAGCASGNPLCCDATEFAACDPNLRVGGCGRPDRCGRINTMCGALNGIAVDRSDANKLFGATEDGLWVWEWPFDGSGGCRPLVDPQCLNPYPNPGIPLAGEWGWSRVQAACPDPLDDGCINSKYLLAVAQDPQDSNRLLAGARDRPDTVGHLDGGLYESNDGGASWHRVAAVPASEAIQRIVFVRPNGGPNLILAAGDGGLYRYQYASGLWDRPFDAVGVRDVSSQDGVTIYLAGMDWDETSYMEGVYRSTDSGTNWVKVVTPQDSQMAMSVIVNSAGTAYAGMVGEGLFRLDAGDPISCGRMTSKIATGAAGSVRAGTAMTAVGDFTDHVQPQNCRSKWAELEFQPSPLGARVRLFDNIPPGPVIPRGGSPLDPGVQLAAPVGSIQGVGDLQGDGCPDIAVGLPRPLAGTGQVVFLDACDLGSVHETLPLMPGTADFGMSMARSGDLLAVGAPSPTAPAVYVYQLGLPPTLLRTLLGPPGCHDLAIGAPGASLGRGAVVWYSWVNDATGLTVTGEGPGDAFGRSTLLTRDATGDLLPDLVVGAPLRDEAGADSGAVYIHEPVALACKTLGPTALAEYGGALAEAGDVDGNRTVDIVIGQPETAAGTTGRVHLRAVLR